MYVKEFRQFGQSNDDIWYMMATTKSVAKCTKYLHIFKFEEHRMKIVLSVALTSHIM